ncbi:hypothetical protein [Anaerobaca lacustris]|uniref:DUF2304 domain-containing protein n=1 Tax=Anaerobaca lacustris TaxID=3044600 RepID=A0AAW6U1R8_9BACT|nr:hypothetical protein [Sedimentisphaerales bacterium M17dextr]
MNSKPDRTLRERLLEMETPNAAQQEAHRQRVQVILDTRLSGAKRVGFAALALVGLLTAIALSSPAFDPPRNWDESFAALLYRLFAIFGFLACVAWIILTSWAAYTGVLRRRHRPWVMTTTLAMGFVYLALPVFTFVVPLSHKGGPPLLGTQLSLMAFSLLNTLGLCVILGVVYRGQFKSQEKLLEIEYRLADLAEKIEERLKS